MTAYSYPYVAAEDGRDTYAVTDGFYNLIDNIPSMQGAENIAAQMNRAWQRGYETAQQEIRAALGLQQR